MADLTATLVSAPRLAASTDLVVAKVASKSGVSVAGAFDMLLSRSPAQPDGTWAAAANTAGTVSLLAGPDSPVGELADGTWWVHLRTGDVVFLVSGPFVITGGDTYVPPADDDDYDGGEVT